MNNGLVSIIIPAYKAELFISEALSSIDQQTYSNWEIIVVEDAWQDNSEKIVDDFSRKSKNRVIYLKHKVNQGLGATRNTGISSACGDYIAFLDHDDIWMPHHLEDAVSALSNCKDGIAYSTTQMFESGTNKNLGLWGPTRNELINFNVSIYCRSFLTPSAVVLHRTVIDKVGLFDTDPKITFSEDHDYWIRAAKEKINFIYLPRITCLYRKSHAGSATSNFKMITERQLSVYKKHIDWEILGKEVKTKVLSECYNYLAIYELQDNKFNAFKKFAKSRKIRPFDIQQIKLFSKSLLRSLIQIH